MAIDFIDDVSKVEVASSTAQNSMGVTEENSDVTSLNGDIEKSVEMANSQEKSDKDNIPAHEGTADLTATAMGVLSNLELSMPRRSVTPCVGLLC